MSNWLNEMYTDPQQVAAAEEQLKIAYAQTAADNGINLGNYTAEQIAADFSQFVEKLAEEGAAHEAAESAAEEKREEASKEHGKKKEESEKKAEAAMMGQLMADNFIAKLASYGVDLTKVADPYGDPESVKRRNSEAHARSLGDTSPHSTGRSSPSSHQAPLSLAQGPNSRELAREGNEAVQAAEKAKEPGLFSKIRSGVGKHLAWKDTSLKSKIGKGVAATAGLAAAGLGTAHALGAFSKKKEEEKTSSPNLDQFAYDEAIKIAAAYEWDPTEAANRVAYAYNNGYVADSEKIAAVQNLDQAVTVRGFEMLESAGYPVNWEGVQAIVFGQ
jgi:hypothetical protein